MAINFQWFPERVIAAVDRAFEERAHRAGAEMVRVARVLANKDTGLMAASTYYTYLPAARTLTLHCDVGYAQFQEYGWYASPGKPFLRPAIAAAAPIFGVRTNMQIGSFLSPSHVARTINRGVRPRIAAQNLRLNRGKVARAALTNIHMNRQNESLRHTAPTGHKFVMKSSASKMNRLRKSWN